MKDLYYSSHFLIMQLGRAAVGPRSLGLASSYNEDLEVERTRADFLALEAELQVAWIEVLSVTKDDCTGGALCEFGKQLLQQLSQGSAGSLWSGLLWVGGEGDGNCVHSQDIVEHNILF